MSLVEIEVKDRVGRLKLNRPEKRNALDDSMVRELVDGLLRLVEDPSAKVVLLMAKGEAFCAGADLAYLQRLQQFTFDQNLEDSRRLKELFLTLYNCPKPTIAQVQGPALAGGCGLVSLCDFVVASDQSRFGYTEVRIGFIPALVSVFLVRRLGEAAASRLMLSGEQIGPQEALKTGLVSAVTTASELEFEVNRLAEVLVSKNSGESMKTTKRLIRESAHLGLDEALELAARRNAEARGSDDCRKGIDSFLSRKPITW